MAGPPPPFTHDELIALGTHLPYDDRLEETDLLDGGDELGQRVLVEHLTRLARVRRNGIEGDLREVRTHGRRGHGRGDVRRCLIRFT
jgi:hypothetical protein